MTRLKDMRLGGVQLLFAAALAEGALIREPFDGEGLPSGWEADLAPHSKCALGVRGALAIYYEAGNYAHIQRALAADGTDERPLVASCRLGVAEKAGVHPMGPALWLYWDVQNWVCVGPGHRDNHSCEAYARWMTERGGDAHGAWETRTEYGRSSSYRLVLTSKKVLFQFSPSGGWYRTFHSIERPKAGGPRLVAVGVGWSDGRRKNPDLDNFHPEARGGRRLVAGADDLLVTRDRPLLPLAPLMQKKETWDETLRSALDSSFPVRWHLIGPFDNKDGKAKDRSYPPEKGLGLDESCEGKGGRRIGWRPFTRAAGERYVDLAEILGREPDACGYALAEIHSPRSRAVKVRFGANDEVQLFLNGRRVFRQKGRGYGPVLDRYQVELPLRAGRNTLLLKASHRTGRWGFFLRVQPWQPMREIAFLRAMRGLFPQDRDAASESLLHEADLWKTLCDYRSAEGAFDELFRTGGASGVVQATRMKEDLFLLLGRRADAARACEEAARSGELSPARRLDELLRASRLSPEPARALEMLKGAEGHDAASCPPARIAWAKVRAVEGTDAWKKALEEVAGLDPFGARACSALCLLPREKAKEEDVTRACKLLEAALEGERSPLVVEFVERARKARSPAARLGPLQVALLRRGILAHAAGAAAEELYPEGLAPPAASRGRDWDASWKLAQAACLDERFVPARWEVTGPFENPDWKGHDTVFSPEKGETPPGMRWKRALPAHLEGSYLSLRKLFGRGDWKVAYARRTFRSEEARDTYLRLGCDDSAKVWLNGKLVFEVRGERSTTPDEFVVPVRLKKGKNECLVKVANGGGDWGFHLRVSDLSHAALRLSLVEHMMASHPLGRDRSRAAEALRVLARELRRARRKGAAFALLWGLSEAFPDLPGYEFGALCDLSGAARDLRAKKTCVKAARAAFAYLERRRVPDVRADTLRDLRYYMADSLRELGEWREAAETYADIVAAAPFSGRVTRALSYLGGLHLSFGDRERARGHYRRLLWRFPGSGEYAGHARSGLQKCSAARRRGGLFNVSFEGKGLMRSASRAMKQEDPRRAASLLRRAMAEHGDSLLRIGPTKLVGVREYSIDRAREWGEGFLAAYGSEFDERAEELYRRGISSLDEALLLRVVNEYYLSSFADDALNALANLWRDRGWPAKAAAALSTASGLPQTDLPRGQLELKRARCLLEAGMIEAAKEALLVLRSSREKVVVGGRKLRAADAARPELSRLSVRKEKAWPGYSGANVWPNELPGAFGPAWRVTLPPGPGQLRARELFHPLPYPLAAHFPAWEEGKAYASDLDELAAVDIRAGKVLWRAGQWAEGRTVGAAPRAVGFAWCAPSVCEGMVYSRRRLYDGLRGREFLAVECRDSSTGELLWSTSGESGMSFASEPTVRSGAVYALAVEMEEVAQAYLVAIEARTGRPIWKTLVGSGSSGVKVAETFHRSCFHSAPPLAVGPDVYVCTSLGSVAAVDAQSGGVRWVETYTPVDIGGYRFSPLKGAFVARGPGEVATSGKLLLVAPRDRFGVMALQRSNGDVVWDRTLVEARGILGAAEGRAFVWGDGVEALDGRTGRTLWRFRAEGRATGRGALVAGGKKVVFPAGGKLFLLDGETGRVLGERPFEGGNIVPGDGFFLAGLEDSIALYRPGRVEKSERKERPRVELPSVPGTGGARAKGAEPGPPLEVMWRLPARRGSRACLPVPPDEPLNGFCALMEDEIRLCRLRPDGKPEETWRTRVRPGARQALWSKGRILVRSRNTIECFGVSTGEKLWSYSLPAETESGLPNESNEDYYEIRSMKLLGDVVLLVQRQSLRALDASTGKQLWKHAVYGMHLSAGGGTQRCAVAVGRVHRRGFCAYGYDPRTGRRLWSKTLDKRVEGHPVAFDDDGGAFAVYWKKSLSMHGAADGAEKWKTECDRYDNDRFPVVRFENGRICLTGKADGGEWRTAAFDAVTGKRLLRVKGIGRIVRDVCLEFTYAERRRTVRAFSLASGEKLWEKEDSHTWGVQTAFASGEGLFVLTDRESGRSAEERSFWQMHLEALDPKTGETLQRLHLPGSPTRTHSWYVRSVHAVRAGGLILYGTEDGVYALGTGEPPRAASYRAFATSAPPRIDGETSEWKRFPSMKLGRDPDGPAAEVRLTWDDGGVYVALDCSDATPASSPPGAWELDGDCVELAFDATCRSLPRLDYRADSAFLVSLSGGRARVRRSFGSGSDADARIRAQASESGTRRTYEVFLPWRSVRPYTDQRPGKERRLGLGVAVYDRAHRVVRTAGMAGEPSPWFFTRVTLVELTPELVKAYWQVIDLLPDERPAWEFLQEIVSSHFGPAAAERRANELLRFLRAHPASANASMALDSLSGIVGRERALAHAREAKVSADEVSEFEGKKYVRAFVYLDPENPPRQVMLQLNSRRYGWAHRAYWGENLIGWGRHGTSERLPMGKLPPLGKWVGLKVSAAKLGVEDLEIRGVAFTWWGGRVFWDRLSFSDGAKETVLMDDELPAGSRWHDGKGQWFEKPAYSGKRSHTKGIVKRVANYHIYRSDPPLYSFREREESPEELKRRLGLYKRAAYIIPTARAGWRFLEQAVEAIEHKDHKETCRARIAAYEDFCKANPASRNCVNALHRVWRLARSAELSQMQECERVVDACGLSRRVRRAFYKDFGPTVTEWWVLGPLDDPGEHRGMRRPYPPEQKVELDAEHEGSGGARIRWTRAKINEREGYVDLRATVGGEKRGMLAYAYTRFNSPRMRRAVLFFGADEVATLWLNGRKVAEMVHGYSSRDRNSVQVTFQRGRNELLLKSAPGGDRWRFYFRIGDANGRPFGDLEFED